MFERYLSENIQKITLDISHQFFNIYLLKIKKRNTRQRCEIYSQLTIIDNKFIILINLNIFHTHFYSVSIFEFEKVNVSCEVMKL